MDRGETVSLKIGVEAIQMFGPQVLRTLNGRRAGAQVGEETTIALNVLLDDAGRAYGPTGLSRPPQSARDPIARRRGCRSTRSTSTRPP